MSTNVAIVTGSNRGLGFALVKGLCKRYSGIVYLTSRDEKRGKDAVEELKKLGLNPEYHQLDITDRESVIKFRDHIKSNHGGIDILINNAAIIGRAVRRNYAEDKAVIDVNYKGLLSVHYFILPLVRDYGRVLNISSDCGHLLNICNKYWLDKLSIENLTVNVINEFVDWFLAASKNETFAREDICDDGNLAAYKVSKVAVSALTFVQQKQLEHRNISVNSVNPGIIKTDMNCGLGDLTPDEAAQTPLYIVLDAPPTLRGAYVWHDRTVRDWYNVNYYYK